MARGSRPRAPEEARDARHLPRAGPTRRLGPLHGRLSRRPLVPTLRPRRVRRVPPRAPRLRLRVQQPQPQPPSRPRPRPRHRRLSCPATSERSGREHHRREDALTTPRGRGVDGSQAILSRVRVAIDGDGGDARVGHRSSSTRAGARGAGRVARCRSRRFNSLILFGMILPSTTRARLTRRVARKPRRLTSPRPPPPLPSAPTGASTSPSPP
jgi:hypothetical protein